MTKHIEEEEKPNRFSGKLRLFIFFFILVLAILYSYGRYVGTTGLVINEINVINNQIPDSFNGLKIVQFSDLHYGRTINEKELKNIVNFAI